MSGLNKVMIIGRLGSDPDLKNVGQGGDSKVVRLSIATSEKWEKDGTKHEKTEWHRVVAWGKLAELCAKYLTKGREVYIEGKLQTSSYEKDGQKRYSTDIIANTVQFLGSNPNASGQPAAQGANPPPPTFDPGDEIPF